MTLADKYISEIIIIANWAKSCKTKEQLDNIDSFLKKYYKRMKPSFYFTQKDSHRVMYHMGIVDGIILSIRKLKFNK